MIPDHLFQAYARLRADELLEQARVQRLAAAARRDSGRSPASRPVVRKRIPRIAHALAVVIPPARMFGRPR
jgi:hypothetical protein